MFMDCYNHDSLFMDLYPWFHVHGLVWQLHRVTQSLPLTQYDKTFSEMIPWRQWKFNCHVWSAFKIAFPIFTCWHSLETPRVKATLMNVTTEVWWRITKITTILFLDYPACSLLSHHNKLRRLCCSRSVTTVFHSSPPNFLCTGNHLYGNIIHQIWKLLFKSSYL